MLVIFDCDGVLVDSEPLSNRARMISSHDAHERPMNVPVVSSTVIGCPAAVSASLSARLDSGSESTSTPSQSKITSTGRRVWAVWETRRPGQVTG